MPSLCGIGKPMKKVDWLKVEKEYVRTKISQRELAKKYKVSEVQVARHSKEGNWVKKRKQFVSKMKAELKKSDEVAAVDKAKVYANIMDKSLYVEQKLLDQTLQTAMAIDMFDDNAINDIKSAQKTIESIVATTEKICFPEHDQTEQHIKITMDKETKDYAI